MFPLTFPFPSLRACGCAVAITAGLVAPATATATAGIERTDGVARTRDGGAVAYRESHWRLAGADGLSRVVLYRCPDGTPFARKRLWGPVDAIAPEFEFVDARDGYREGVRRAGGGLEVFWRERAGERERRADVAADGTTVFDAGFDAFVRRGWAAVTAGGVLRARFLLPSRQSTVPIRIAPRPSGSGDAGTVLLRMTVDAWYGGLAPRTDLTYSADGRLLRFEGIGTIRDERGRHRDVRIDFPASGRDVARADVDAALSSPLARTCAG